MSELPKPSVALDDFQRLIRNMYHEKDVARGVDGTFMWLMEEVGELATALREGSHADRLEEFADVLAWLATIANVSGIDLERAVVAKYGAGCPGCGAPTFPGGGGARNINKNRTQHANSEPRSGEQKFLEPRK